MKPFYMVYLENGRCPAARHATVEGAKAEARRLARETKRRAFVLQSRTSIQLAPEFIEEDYETDELPF